MLSAFQPYIGSLAHHFSCDIVQPLNFLCMTWFASLAPRKCITTKQTKLVSSGGAHFIKSHQRDGVHIRKLNSQAHKFSALLEMYTRTVLDESSIKEQ